MEVGSEILYTWSRSIWKVLEILIIGKCRGNLRIMHILWFMYIICSVWWQVLEFGVLIFVCGVSGANTDSVRNWSLHFLQRAGVLGHSGRPLVRGSGLMAEYLSFNDSFWWDDVGRVQPRAIQWYCWWTKSCTTKDDDYPIIYRVLTIAGGAGFRPSAVNSTSLYSCWWATLLTLHVTIRRISCQTKSSYRCNALCPIEEMVLLRIILCCLAIWHQTQNDRLAQVDIWNSVFAGLPPGQSHIHQLDFICPSKVSFWGIVTWSWPNPSVELVALCQTLEL